jgi:hypothetical protein
MYNIILNNKQKKYLEDISIYGGIILFDDTSSVFVCDDKGNSLDFPIPIPYSIFNTLEFIGLIVYEKEIGRDQYFYKVNHHNKNRHLFL